MLTLPFGHYYYKLEKVRFTTIRGKSYSKLKIGTTIKAIIVNKKVDVKIINLELKKISEIPFEVLKEDTSYPGFEITTKDDFVKLINTFRRGYMPKATLNSKVTIITLEKI